MKKTTKIIIALLFSGLTINAQTTSPTPYCNAGFDDDPFAVDDAIFGVTLGTLNNPSNAQSAAPHYIYYSNLTAPNLLKGSVQTLSVTFDVKGGVGIGAWIDYNHNNIFETTEKILNNPAGGVPIALTTQTVSFTVPTGAVTGTTRMRVRIVEDDNYNMTNNYVIAPCNASTSSTDIMDWGETEDYPINITTATGIKESGLHASIISYPNPVENIFSVIVKNAINIHKVSMNSMDGTPLKVNFNHLNDLITADLSALATGIYFLEVITSEGTMYTKIIKN